MSLVMRKPAFSICENKDADKLRSNSLLSKSEIPLLSKSLFYLNPKFQASSLPLWVYCVRPGRKPRRPVFSQRDSYVVLLKDHDIKPVKCSSLFMRCLINLKRHIVILRVLNRLCLKPYPPCRRCAAHLSEAGNG